MDEDRLSKAIDQIKWEAERALWWRNLDGMRAYFCALFYLMERNEWQEWRDEFTAKVRDKVGDTWMR